LGGAKDIFQFGRVVGLPACRQARAGVEKYPWSAIK